jgi:hypothetical protein
MTAGVLIYNNANTVLIDDNYSNLAVRYSGWVTLGASETMRTVALGAMELPIVATRGNQFCRGVINLARDGIIIQGVPGTSIQYFMFDRPIASGAAGLQVFDTVRRLVFDSSRQYARVRDAFAGQQLTAWTGTRTYDAGRVYAMAQLKGAFRETLESKQDPNSPPGWFLPRRTMYASAARISGASVVTDLVTFVEGAWSELPVKNPGSPRTPDYAAAIAIIDVTGY